MSRPRGRVLLALAALIGLAGACTRVDEPRQGEAPSSGSARSAHEEPTQRPAVPVAPAPTPPTQQPAPQQAPLPSAKTGKLSWSHAPAGDVAAIAHAFAQAASAAGRAPLVYVGAPWCEPCQHFHEAATRGELDARFGDLAILEFNLDVDADRLRDAWYTADLIPLLAVPASDGRSTDRKMFGSLKGAGAVANMTPRLAKLLGR